MQTRNPLLNDFAELMTDAFAAAQAAGDEARTAMRAQAEKFVAHMDLVPREEFEAVKAVAASARAEVEALEQRIAVLEAAAAPKPVARKAPAKKAAAKKTTRKSS
ncbi:accessory factor UbiK family protein [Hyphobacterium marinum]|uniref:Accessory factor UbiK family protein n=1 Tax=Hyphobacterium marinum TaxID=3116574 RepID=A0ABU7M0U7_9PROT|nr:accessory factor UbiK family protein [Hyphobacterium sp. Y6023]MEE2567429.1 accessory factor UbiK family protein [Hyphobacterium sp. Y6023]